MSSSGLVRNPMQQPPPRTTTTNKKEGRMERASDWLGLYTCWLLIPLHNRCLPEKWATASECGVTSFGFPGYDKGEQDKQPCSGMRDAQYSEDERQIDSITCWFQSSDPPSKAWTVVALGTLHQKQTLTHARSQSIDNPRCR